MNQNKFSQSDQKRAQIVVGLARMCAIGSYMPMAKQFPEFDSIHDSGLMPCWDYLVTVASVGTAFMQIGDIVPSAEQAGMAYAIKEAINEWQQDAYDAMVDFLEYVKPLIDSGVRMDAAIGAWVWVNLETQKNANPNLKKLASSLELVVPTGHLLMDAFHDWYNELELKE